MVDLITLGSDNNSDPNYRQYILKFKESNKTPDVKPENLPQIQEIRRIQEKIARVFKTSTICVSTSTCTRANFRGTNLSPGTFEVRNDYSSLITTNNPIILLRYQSSPVDFARGASFMFSNPGIPIDENFYIRFNRT